MIFLCVSSIYTQQKKKMYREKKHEKERTHLPIAIQKQASTSSPSSVSHILVMPTEEHDHASPYYV